MRPPNARLNLDDLEGLIAAALSGEAVTCVWAGVDPIPELLDDLAANPTPTATDIEHVRTVAVEVLASWDSDRSTDQSAALPAS